MNCRIAKRLAARALAIAGVIALVCSLGCTKFHGDYTVLSNKLVRTSDFDLSTADKREKVEGTDIAHIIFFIPTKAQVTLEEALEDALEKGDGDVMTDAKVWFWSWWFIYGQTGWRVTGDVIKTRN